MCFGKSNPRSGQGREDLIGRPQMMWAPVLLRRTWLQRPMTEGEKPGGRKLAGRSLKLAPARRRYDDE